MNRKGQVLDIITLIAGIFGVAITLIIGIVVFSSVMTEFNNNGIIPDEINATVQDSNSKFQGGFVIFDSLLFPIGLIGLIIGLVISGFLIPTHPIFMIINIIGIVFLVLLSIVLNAVYGELAANPILASGASVLVVTPLMMKALPIIGVVATLVSTIIGFGKRGDNL